MFHSPTLQFLISLVGTCLLLWLSPSSAFAPLSTSASAATTMQQQGHVAVTRSTSFTTLYHTNDNNSKIKKTKSRKSGGGGFASASLLQETFPYTGLIRPGHLSPPRVVPNDDRSKPDYWETGIPLSNGGGGGSKLRLPWMIEVKTEEEQEKMRAAGRLARHVLDTAGRAVRVGITTDEIDALVHKETIQVRFCVVVTGFLGSGFCVWNEYTKFLCFLRTSIGGSLPISIKLPRLSKVLLHIGQRSYLPWNS